MNQTITKALERWQSRRDHLRATYAEYSKQGGTVWYTRWQKALRMDRTAMNRYGKALRGETE